MNEKFTKLAEPFPPEDIEWRAGATTSDKSKALALAYITSRAIMNRLDDVVGPENWRDEYAPGPNGGVVCGLSLRVGDEWITKWDGADNSDIEGIKGGLSDAFKRAGYKWGIGRYLYKLDGVWVKCEVYGKTVKLSETPKLPAWALPSGSKPTQQKPAPAASVPATLPETKAKINGANGSPKPAWPKAWKEKLISAKYADNEFEAAGMLGKSHFITPTSELTPELIAGWGKHYRADRDSGGTPEHAADTADAKLKAHLQPA